MTTALSTEGEFTDHGLTHLQRQILELACEGMDGGRIASLLERTDEEMASDWIAIKTKLAVQTKFAAVKYWLGVRGRSR